MPHAETVRVVTADGGPRLPLLEGRGCVAVAVVWPGMGAQQRSMHHMALVPGGTTKVQRHPMEAVYYVLAGDGSVNDPEAATTTPLASGSMVHIEPDTPYVFEAGGAGLSLIGGPCPPDPTLYRGIDRT